MLGSFNFNEQCMQSQPQLTSIREDKKTNKPPRSFNNRNRSHFLPPHSIEFSHAKQKAYERYKKYYPLQDKENIYPLSKTPNIGFYLMKGYKQDLNSLRESTEVNNGQTTYSSNKMVTHLLKKYLVRKQHAMTKQVDRLPKLDHSLNIAVQLGENRGNLKTRKSQHSRAYTEYDERSLRPKQLKI